MLPMTDVEHFETTAKELELERLDRNRGHGFLKMVFGPPRRGRGHADDFWPSMASQVVGACADLASRLPCMRGSGSSKEWPLRALTPAFAARMSLDEDAIHRALMPSATAFSGNYFLGRQWPKMSDVTKDGIRKHIATQRCADEDWTWATLLFEAKFMPSISEGALRMCDPLKADAHGFTPLMHAAKSGSVEKIQSLLPLSDSAAVDSRGQTALDVAQGDAKQFMRALIEVDEIKAAVAPEAFAPARRRSSARL